MNAKIEEKSLFITCLAPLELEIYSTRKTLWTNPRPGSPFYCRPLRLKYIKETKETIKQEEEVVNRETKALVEKGMEIDGRRVNFFFNLTMIDGKAATTMSLVTDAFSNCPICGIPPMEMLKKEKIIQRKEKLKKENLKYSISTLHCWIRDKIHQKNVYA